MSNLTGTLREHMDMAFTIQNKCDRMNNVEITHDEIKNCLKELKKGKAAGPDKLKPELYKEIEKSPICLETLKNCFQNIIETGEVPESWLISQTVMVPKTCKPEVKDLRPISLTNISYKIFMKIIRNKIDNHLLKNKLEKEVQAGFTSNRRIEDNIFILQH